MANQAVDQSLLVAQTLPTRVPDATPGVASPRVAAYKEQYVQMIFAGEENQADEGSYFIATSPTPGTAIAYGSGGTQASFADTVPFFVFKNDAPAGSPIRAYLKNLKLIQNGTAPATTTSVQAAVKIDPGNRFFTSAATTYQQITPVNPNGGSGAQPVTKLWVPNGAVATIPGLITGSTRLVGRAMLKGGPTLNLDQYELMFGPSDTPSLGGYLTTVSKYCERLEPVILAAQQFAIVHLWFPGGATSPFSFEFSSSWRER